MNFSLGRTLSLFVYLFVFGLYIPVHSQDLDDVTIFGQVLDRNGQAVIGATVTAVHIQSGTERILVTDNYGQYRFIKLPPGIYEVKAEAQGFSTKKRIGIDALSGQALKLDLDLEPAKVEASTVVTVDDEDLPLIDTTRTIVGSTLTEREVEEIPNNARNPLDLVLTLGGTSEEALSTSDLAEDRDANPRSTPFEQGNFSLSGGTSYSNNITIAGLDNNDDRSARDRFQPSLEAIAEVQVIRNQFSAEYGRASGGRVNLRTRSGTNRFRGRAFFFFRDDSFNANSWYNNSRGIPRLPFTQYNPGFTLSGPIVLPFYDGRRRTFFAVAYEYQRFEDTTLIDTFIPVDPNPRFQLPAPNGSAQYCDAAGSPPPPCTAGVGAVSQFTSIVPTPNSGNILTARIDHRLNKANTFTFGFQFGRRKNRRTPGLSATTRLEEALQARRIYTDAFNVTNNHVFNASLVNQFRFQWSVYKPSFQTNNPGDPVVLVSYRNPITNAVQTLIAGNSSANSLQNFADTRTETRYQIQDTLTYVKGAHTLKFGFDIQSVDSRARALENGTGTFNFSSVFNYSNNSATRFRQNFGQATDVKNTYFGIFFNDEFRIRPNLAINYGLRYERETAVSDNNNFGPRLGVAWDPSKNGNGVLRFGAGVFYNRVLLRTVGDFIQNQGGTLVQFDTNTIPTSTGPNTLNPRNQILNAISQQFPSGFASPDQIRALISAQNCGPIANPSPCNTNYGFARFTGSSGNPLRSVDPDLRIPVSYQFNVGYEHKIGRNWVAEANYTWNKTNRLWREYNINLPLLPAGYNDFTSYLLANPYIFTNFNGTTRTYNFYLGPTNDTSGVSTNPATQTGTCGTTVNVTCWINLNTLNTSTVVPNTNAGDGVSSNSIGGPIAIAREALRHLRPDPSVDEMERVASIGNSQYHGLVLELRRRYRSLGYGFGLSTRMAYTLSRTMDDGLNNTTNAEVNGDFRREWARARQDRLHRFSMSGALDTPRWLGKLRFSPVFRYGSASRFSLGYGIDRNLNDTSTDRVIFSGNLKDIRWRKPGSPVPTALLSQFSLQPIGAVSGNLPRNAGTGPSLYIFDLGITREWRFGERRRLRPNIEIGNVLNMAVFSFGSEFIDLVAAGPNPTPTQQLALQNFLVPTRTYRQRDIRFGVRFDF
ncbi:TonB-dependent receptor [Leptolyngbya sp. 7M]|uniref:TonB-dependent receptor n=1 Tax=Leptolyngbya sp. 7M TaxID=2812896 RepID=UPI001B8D6DC4|nr:TonB-dependent receptor [Leptolyngbya sp. 7M]QYO65682.1 carboxypeptidase regulatory-like domain-containing protein [Leptolyngbya sp. 7M]